MAAPKRMKAHATFDLYQTDQSPKNRKIIAALREFVKRVAPKLVPTAGALASLLLISAACDDVETDESDVVMTAEECADQGGRQVANPGGGAPSCRDDEVQIGLIFGIEYGRCCRAR